MTREELIRFIESLDMEYEVQATTIYVFYRLPDGRMDNFSINVRSAGGMSDEDLLRMMRREYPATRQGKVLSVERPEWEPTMEMVEVTEVYHMTNVSVRAWVG